MNPVQAGVRVRIHSTVKTAERTPKGLLFTRESVMEIEGQERPAMVVEMLAMVLESDQQ